MPNMFNDNQNDESRSKIEKIKAKVLQIGEMLETPLDTSWIDDVNSYKEFSILTLGSLLVFELSGNKLTEDAQTSFMVGAFLARSMVTYK